MRTRLRGLAVAVLPLAVGWSLSSVVSANTEPEALRQRVSTFGPADRAATTAKQAIERTASGEPPKRFDMGAIREVNGAK